MIEDKRFSRLIWISRSVRQPSMRRLSQYVCEMRRQNEESGHMGLLIVQGRYRLHVIEGETSSVDGLFETFRQNASGVGLRLISVDEIAAPACGQPLMCLDLTGMGPSAYSLEQIFGRAMLPDYASRERVIVFLRDCLSLHELKHAA